MEVCRQSALAELLVLQAVVLALFQRLAEAVVVGYQRRGELIFPVFAVCSIRFSSHFWQIWLRKKRLPVPGLKMLSDLRAVAQAQEASRDHCWNLFAGRKKVLCESASARARVLL